MWYDVSIENARLVCDLMQLQHAMIGPNPQMEMSRIARVHLHPANAIHLYPMEGRRCDLGLLDMQQVDLVLLGPARNPQMILGCMSGFNWTNSLSQPSPGNGEAFVIARELRQKMVDLGFWNTRPKIFSGHSWGGCVVQALTYLWSYEFNSHQYRMVAFGAPKCCTEPMIALFDTTKINLFICARDTVPYVMPNADEAPEAHALMPNGISRLWARYKWITSFYRLEDDLTLNITAEPTPATLPRTLAMLEWMSGIQGFRAPAHTSIHYMTQLLRYVNLSQQRPYPGAVPTETLAIETAIPSPPSAPIQVEYMEKFPDQVVTQAFNFSATPSPNPPYVSGGGGYAVTVNGTTVGTAKSRRYARRVEQKAEGLKRMTSGLENFDAAALASAIIS